MKRSAHHIVFRLASPCPYPALFHQVLRPALTPNGPPNTAARRHASLVGKGALRTAEELLATSAVVLALKHPEPIGV